MKRSHQESILKIKCFRCSYLKIVSWDRNLIGNVIDDIIQIFWKCPKCEK